MCSCETARSPRALLLLLRRQNSHPNPLVGNTQQLRSISCSAVQSLFSKIFVETRTDHRVARSSPVSSPVPIDRLGMCPSPIAVEPLAYSADAAGRHCCDCATNVSTPVCMSSERCLVLLKPLFVADGQRTRMRTRSGGDFYRTLERSAVIGSKRSRGPLSSSNAIPSLADRLARTMHKHVVRWTPKSLI